MDVIKAISTRRSIRKFKPGSKVDEETVTEFLRAAMMGPCSGNGKPWEFIVIRDRDILDRVAEMSSYTNSILEHTAIMIVVVSNKNKEKYENRWIQDCSVAMQNILLVVHAKGYGGSWQEIYPVEKTAKGINDILKLPDNITPFAMIPIGEPDDEKEYRDTYDKDKIHYEKW